MPLASIEYVPPLHPSPHESLSVNTTTLSVHGYVLEPSSTVAGSWLVAVESVQPVIQKALFPSRLIQLLQIVIHLNKIVPESIKIEYVPPFHPPTLHSHTCWCNNHRVNKHQQCKLRMNHIQNQMQLPNRLS